MKGWKDKITAKLGDWFAFGLRILFGVNLVAIGVFLIWFVCWWLIRFSQYLHRVWFSNEW